LKLEEKNKCQSTPLPGEVVVVGSFFAAALPLTALLPSQRPGASDLGIVSRK